MSFFESFIKSHFLIIKFKFFQLLNLNFLELLNLNTFLVKDLKN